MGFTEGADIMPPREFFAPFGGLCILGKMLQINAN
jgi:hypothetical protein